MSHPVAGQHARVVRQRRAVETDQDEVFVAQRHQQGGVFQGQAGAVLPIGDVRQGKSRFEPPAR
jgi:hypothetical protein